MTVDEVLLLLVASGTLGAIAIASGSIKNAVEYFMRKRRR